MDQKKRPNLRAQLIVGAVIIISGTIAGLLVRSIPWLNEDPARTTIAGILITLGLPAMLILVVMGLVALAGRSGEL